MTREELEKQIKYLKDKMEVCSYGSQEIEELTELENKLNRFEEEL